MTEWKGADPPISLVLIHRVITRGLEVGMRHAASFARDGYAGPAAGAGFALYLRALAGVLHQHHSGEDEIAFPFLRERLPGLPLDALIAEHVQMASVLEEMTPLLDMLKGQAGEGAALEAAGEALARLAKIWPGHIGVEETIISMKRLGTVAGAEELAAWLASMARHRPEGAAPDAVTVPFVLYNLSPEDRAIMAKNMPPLITQELVPGPWLAQWAPMKPFLLD
ncbi:MAG: hemerythrin domain-containing protein [Anaerolineae bacterium]|jgi:hemerythrin-like domain-containing protein